MTAPPVRILAQRAGWLAVDKPAGIPTEPAPGFEVSLLDAVGVTTGHAREALHPVNRLDVVVSGVVLLALSAEARKEAAALTAEHRIERRYLGLVELVDGAASKLPERPGRWEAPIGRGRGRRIVGGSRAEPAETDFALVGVSSSMALFAFAPVTGRTHQIRTHASHAGFPLLFDRRYGGRSRFVLPDGRVVGSDRIGLHAARMVVPTSRGPWEVFAPVPKELVEWWAASGGAAEVFDTALSFPVGPCQQETR